MKKIPSDPQADFIIALAGPAVNIFLAALWFLLTGGELPVPFVESLNSLRDARLRGPLKVDSTG